MCASLMFVPPHGEFLSFAGEGLRDGTFFSSGRATFGDSVILAGRRRCICDADRDCCHGCKEVSERRASGRRRHKRHVDRSVSDITSPQAVEKSSL